MTVKKNMQEIEGERNTQRKEGKTNNKKKKEGKTEEKEGKETFTSHC